MAAEAGVSSVTECLAKWVATIADSDIPPDVREAARWLIVDHLACAIGGSTLTPGQILLDFAREQGGRPQATIYATGERTTLPHMVYVNAALSNLLDFDDTFGAVAHPGGTVISPAIGMAEHLDRPGRDVVTAVVLGYEVMLRIMQAATPSPERYRQVAGFSVWQTFGAMAAAARVLGLKAEEMCHAFGLAAMNAPVPNVRKLGLELEERPFSWSKNNYGWAAAGGVLGAMLAKRGFLGNRAILDGDRGFWIMAGSDRWSPEQVTASLGRSWLLPQTGFKPYAACRWTHTAIDAVRELKSQHPELTPEMVHGLRLNTFYEVAQKLSTVDPTDIIDAQFSVRHLMALELVGRSARYGLTETDLHDETVARVRRQIELVEDPALSARYFQERAMPAQLTVATTDGRELSVAVDDPWGNPGQPFAHDDILAKYRELTVPIIGHAASECLVSGVLALDEVESIRPILPTREMITSRSFCP